MSSWDARFALEADGQRKTLTELLNQGRAELDWFQLQSRAPNQPAILHATDRAAFVRSLLALRQRGFAVVPWPDGLDPSESTRRTKAIGARYEVTTAPKVAARPGPGPGDPLGAEFAVFTSGTEGPAKAALLPEERLQRHATLSGPRVHSGPASRWLLSISPAHIGGLAMLTRCLAQGSTLVIPEGPRPQNLDLLVNVQRITHLSLVPTQLRRWLIARAGAAPLVGLRRVLVGGAPVPAALVQEARVAGIPAVATYGLTEACSQVATQGLNSPDGTVGKPLPETKVLIVDEGASPVSAGVAGRILVQGPTLFSGYHGDADATSTALRDGRLWTHDRGVLDDAGNLTVLGRIGRVINSGGLKVDPARVEAVLDAHPGVVEAAVLGRPDPQWGQAIVAFVVVVGEARSEDLVQWCRERLSLHEVPKTIVILPSLPKTSGGKVDAGRLPG